MGLAASQARLLSITSRISDNELRAQLINNQKMRLATESSQVSENYISALNKSKLVFANYDKDDNAQNVPLTFNNLTAFNQYNNQYGLTNAAGNILISETEAELYQKSVGAIDPATEFLRLHGIEHTTSYWDEIADQLGANQITYTAEQLRLMYEGDPTNDITPYNETIKTQEYTDFSGYLDDFITAKGFYDNALDKATKEAIDGIGNKQYSIGGTNKTLNGILEDDPVYLFQSNTQNLKNLLTTVLNDNCKPGTDVAGFVNNLFNSSSENYINMKYDGSKFIQQGTYTDLGLGANASLYGNSTTNNSLTYTDTDNNVVYMNIGSVTTDENGNDVIGWVKIGTTGGGSFVPDTSDMVIYKKDGTNMTQVLDLAEDGTSQGMTISNKSFSMNQFSFDMPVEYQDASGNIQSATQTMTIKYPTLNSTSLVQGTGTGNVSGVTADLSGDKNGMSDAINLALTTILEETYDFLRTNMKDVDATTSSDPDVQNALQECIDIGQNLANTILGLNADGTPIVTVNKDNIDALYNYVSDVVDGNIASTDPCLGHIPKKEFQSVVNAYILDTVMDIFGEPVYGYLYTDGEGNVIKNENPENPEDKYYNKNGSTNASAEAEWYLNLFDKIQSSGYQVLANGLASSTDWLQFALENGIVVMEQINGEGEWQGITYTSCSDISEQTDETAAALAEAEYNQAMRQIEAKDEMYDMELKNIDTEHSSLQAEYESVKKAMSGNIERNFQMYS